MFGLAIFDSDGTLVDSGDIDDEVVASVLQDIGVLATSRDIARISLGMTDAEMWAALEQEFSVVVSPELRQKCDRVLHEKLEELTRPIPQVEVALNCLRRMNVRLCVASNGTHEKMNVTLRVAGLRPYFGESVFSALDVPRGKPHPDLFLEAARCVGIAAEHCAVIEDSMLGVQAGIAAGMTVFHYCPERNLPRTSHGQVVVFERFTELPGLLELHSP